MNIRELQLKDAPLMLEWMLDKSVVKDLQGDFCNKTIEDCRNFIIASWKDETNIHLAIVDDADTYMGTVSLKHIDMYRKQAEFAIAIRSCAMGRGISQYAMKEILRKGFKEMGLGKIFWCVSENNKRAIRFYEKNGYKRANINIIPYRGGVQRFSTSVLYLVSGGEIKKKVELVYWILFQNYLFVKAFS